MKDWYKQKHIEALAKAKAAAEMGDYSEFERWSNEAHNYAMMMERAE